ncbi:MAG TPA: SUMF1/EgtB/PvdO family nonheme iron enzyme [Planctomycetota bacterium]|nr:SUMF1/EgtB/PvdO family nonheme iron enzyme [Planctomycetota bacterium]
MAGVELRPTDAFPCVRCGAPCAVTRAGDLLIAICPAGDPRYVLTVQAPGDSVTVQAEDALVGQTLGPCRLVARAGFEGGLPIYQGLDAALNQSRTVRVLTGAAARDRTLWHAFVRTGKLAAAARHAALANVTHLARFEGGLFTIAPALEGQTFLQAVEGAGRLALPDAVRIVRRLAEAIAALHERGIIHRNVGPHSVFVLPNGEPMLRNFAFAIGPESPLEPKEVVGQPGFLAPEQVAGNALGGPADLYSLGALLYLALVGRPPFPGATAPDAIRSQLAGPAAAREALTSCAPPELVDLLMRLLASAPGARPAHARGLIDALAKPAVLSPRGRSAGSGLHLDEATIALAKPAPLPAKRPRPAAQPRARQEAPAAAQDDIFALATDEPVEENERRRLLPSLEIGPRPDEKPAAPAPALRRPAARPAPAARTSRPGPPADELVLQAEEPPGGSSGDGAAVPIPESEPTRGLLTPRAMLLAGVAAAALGIFLVTRFVSCGSEPDSTAVADKGGRPARPGKRALTDAEKANADVEREFARIGALARKGPKEAEEVVKLCEAFLQQYSTSGHAGTVTKIRDDALALQRERDADTDYRALQPLLRDSKAAYTRRVEALDAFLKKHAGAKAAALGQKQREQIVTAQEGAAERAAALQKTNIEKHLKAEAYGPILDLLTGVAQTYEGTKAGATAAAQAVELRQKLAGEFKEAMAAAEQRVRRAAFSDAIARLDAPLNRWQLEDVRRQADDFVASLRQRRGKVVQGYGAFLSGFDDLAGEWKLEDAHAAATEAAAKADDPVLRELLEAKASETAVLLRARDRITAGAKAEQTKAEQAKAAGGDGKIWLQRSSGARLKAIIDDPSPAGLNADMLGYKGRVGWGEMHVDQLLLFGRAAPGQAAAADHLALGLVALRAGDMEAAFEEFTKAGELEPGALDAAVAFLRHHAQGFVRLPGGRFLAGPRKEAAALDDFLLGRGEVTNAEFAFFAQVTKAALPPDWKVGLDNHPVANITWQQADAYALWLDMRLPTDLEWERAVRGTEGRLYPWGDTFEAGRVNLARAGAKGPLAPSALLPAYRHPRRDDFPFYHLCGNVREWTGSPVLDARGAVASYRVVGGSAADPEAAAAAHARLTRKADLRDPYTGFRLAWPR